MEETKTCTKCKSNKSTANFSKNKAAKDGLFAWCKQCVKEHDAKRYWADPDSFRKKSLKYKYDHVEDRREYDKKRYHEDKPKARERLKKFHENNPNYKKDWYINNPGYYTKYVKERSKKDLSFKIAINLRKRLSDIVTGKMKAGSAVRDLGCSVEEFIKHIESLWRPGMTWDNHGIGYGTWQLDHKKALCYFNLTIREEFLEACHYTNLQPLWYEEHLIKSANDSSRYQKGEKLI